MVRMSAAAALLLTGLLALGALPLAAEGTVAVGLEADLLVVDRNPLTDLTTLFEPMLVVADGRVAVNRLDR